MDSLGWRFGPVPSGDLGTGRELDRSCGRALWVEAGGGGDARVPAASDDALGLGLDLAAVVVVVVVVLGG